MGFFLKQFFSQNSQLCVTEFGHSIIENTKAVGPWSREIYILHFVSKGYCQFSGFRVEEGQAFFISKGLRHSFTTSNNYEHYWIGFNGDAVESFFKIFNLEAKPHQLFFVENPDFAKTLFSDAMPKLQSEDTKHQYSVAFSVLAALLPLLKKENYSEMSQETNYAEKAQNFIETNYIYPIKMTEIAKELNITEKYMYRLFLKRFGISPQKFLLKTRMEMAKTMLIKTDFNVKEVAYSVGYSSLPSFSKAFSNYFGFSPGSLKKTRQ